MIVNPWTVSALSLDVVSAGLGVIAATLTIKQFVATPGYTPGTGEKLAEIEDRLYLLFWMGAVFLCLRFLAWPLFYLSLHSIISEVSGAMCIFGTRNLQPTLTRIIELTKPLLFYGGLVWLLVFRLERFFQQSGTGGSQARKSSMSLLCLCLFAGLIDSFSSIVLWIRSNAELAVSCCTTITDIPTRFTVWIPVSLLGHEYQTLLWWLFYGCNILLILSALFVRMRLKPTCNDIPFFLLFLFALINSIIGIFAFIEVIAPRLMHLPFHHCLYCMVQKVLDAPLFLALFIAGNTILAAIFPMRSLACKWAEAPHIRSLTSKLLFFGAIFLSGNLLMITTHLFQ